MSLSYIRKYYGVPAHEGARVEYSGGGKTQLGTITGSESAHLMVQIDGAEEPTPFHPTWKIRYLEDPVIAALAP